MKPTSEQIAAIFKVLRKDADASGYGWAIDNDKLEDMATECAMAILSATPAQKEK